ncbi:MAG: TolC family protein [Candidatus Eremiobacteraeota bacterium]|nr:TolC family protein [Candidatus Eremiobacteraeota bacterium]
MKRLLFACAVTALVLALPVPRALAQTLPLALPTETPGPLPTGSPLPYPAYGTPAPGLAAGKPVPGVPQRVTLVQAVEIAAARSPVLASARASVELAEAQVKLARVPIQPNLSGTASTTHTNSQAGSSTLTGSNGGGRTFGGTSGGPITSNFLSADLRQLIFDGGKTIAQIQSANENEVAQANTFRRDLQTLTFNVAQAYYNALGAQYATILAQQVVHQNEVQAELVAAQLRAGTASRVDLATAEVPVATARVALVRAQGTELAAYATLANTLGIDADANLRPLNDTPTIRTESLLPAPVLDYDRAIERALSLRPDFYAAENSVSSAQSALRAADLGYVPNIQGTASYGTSSTDPTGGTYRNSNSVGAVLTIPFYDAGATAAARAQAKANLDNADANLDSVRLGVQLNVKQALVNLISAQAAVLQADVALSQAKTVVDATQAQFRAGVTTLPLLLIAQTNLTTAQTDALSTIYTLRQNEQAYLYALGENDTDLLGGKIPHP